MSVPSHEHEPSPKHYDPASGDYRRAEFEFSGENEEFPSGRFDAIKEFEPPAEDDLRKLVTVLDGLCTEDAHPEGELFWLRREEIPRSAIKQHRQRQWLEIFIASLKMRSTFTLDPRYVLTRSEEGEKGKKTTHRTYAVYDADGKLSVDFIPDSETLRKVSVELRPYIDSLRRRADALIIEEADLEPQEQLGRVKEHTEQRNASWEKGRDQRPVSAAEVQQLLDDLDAIVKKLRKENRL